MVDISIVRLPSPQRRHSIVGRFCASIVRMQTIPAPAPYPHVFVGAMRDGGGGQGRGVGVKRAG